MLEGLILLALFALALAGLGQLATLRDPDRGVDRGVTLRDQEMTAVAYGRSLLDSRAKRRLKLIVGLVLFFSPYIGIGILLLV